jgi:hypothetical protein
MWSQITGALGKLVEPVTQIVGNWQKRITQRQEHKLQLQQARTEAKIARLKAAQEHKHAWERLALEESGWKDEWILALISMPAVLSFVPGQAETVQRGFAVLAETPDWYKAAWGAAVSSAYGIRKLHKRFMQKKASAE